MLWALHDNADSADGLPGAFLAFNGSLMLAFWVYQGTWADTSTSPASPAAAQEAAAPTSSAAAAQEAAAPTGQSHPSDAISRSDSQAPYSNAASLEKMPSQVGVGGMGHAAC